MSTIEMTGPSARALLPEAAPAGAGPAPAIPGAGTPSEATQDRVYSAAELWRYKAALFYFNYLYWMAISSVQIVLIRLFSNAVSRAIGGKIRAQCKATQQAGTGECYVRVWQEKSCAPPFEDEGECMTPSDAATVALNEWMEDVIDKDDGVYVAYFFWLVMWISLQEVHRNWQLWARLTSVYRRTLVLGDPALSFRVELVPASSWLRVLPDWAHPYAGRWLPAIAVNGFSLVIGAGMVAKLLLVMLFMGTSRQLVFADDVVGTGVALNCVAARFILDLDDPVVARLLDTLHLLALPPSAEVSSHEQFGPELVFATEHLAGAKMSPWAAALATGVSALTPTQSPWRTVERFGVGSVAVVVALMSVLYEFSVSTLDVYVFEKTDMDFVAAYPWEGILPWDW